MSVFSIKYSLFSFFTICVLHSVVDIISDKWQNPNRIDFLLKQLRNAFFLDHAQMSNLKGAEPGLNQETHKVRLM